MALWHYPAHKPQGWFNPIESEPLEPSHNDALTSQMAHFAGVIRGDEEPLVSGREGFAYPKSDPIDPRFNRHYEKPAPN